MRVRGRGSVFRVILHKVAGWNVLRAATSEKLRALVRAEVARTLKSGEFGLNGSSWDAILRLWDGIAAVSQAFHDLRGLRAA